MKKLLSLILVMCMALTAVSSLAEGDLTGTWYLNSLGMCAASIEINAEGTCAVTASTENGEERQEGTWTLDGDNPVLTVGEQNLPMTWDGETLSLDMQAILALVPDTAGMDLSSLDPSMLNSFFQISREPEKISAADFAAINMLELLGSTKILSAFISSKLAKKSFTDGFLPCPPSMTASAPNSFNISISPLPEATVQSPKLLLAR